MLKSPYRFKQLFWLLGIIFFCSPQPIMAAEVAELPKPPQRGTPEGSSTAGGSRTEPEASLSGCQGDSIAYLLDSGIRDYTIAAYPSFWFYVPFGERKAIDAKFSLAESSTGKIVYQRGIDLQKPSGIIGVALPQEQQYALKPNQDYVWQLQINCAAANSDNRADDHNLKGWVRRLPINSQLESQLQNSSNNKYDVYAEQNLLYDALSELIQLRQQKPNNEAINRAWIELLGDLGKPQLTREETIKVGLE